MALSGGPARGDEVIDQRPPLFVVGLVYPLAVVRKTTKPDRTVASIVLPATATVMHYAENLPIKPHLNVGPFNIFKALALTDADLRALRGVAGPGR